MSTKYIGAIDPPGWVEHDPIEILENTKQVVWQVIRQARIRAVAIVGSGIANQRETTYLVPAFSGLFAPYWRSDARGIIVGLSRYITKAHIARAALEAAAFQTKDIYEAMERDAELRIQNLKVDGGMTVNELLM